MVKTRIVVCGAVAFAVMVATGSVPCEAQPNPVDVLIRITEAPPGTWNIEIVDPKGPDICRPSVSLPICEGDEITWKVTGQPLAQGEEVIVRQASVAPFDCFQQQSWTIKDSTPNHSVSSGPITCPIPAEVSKYGVLWPYDVEFWKDGAKKAETDPRGIVH